jgi:DNA transposition AAA+ family ATPase
VATRQLQQQAAAERAAYRHWTLRPGQLVIIDEASMAATTDLDHIITVASRAGAKVLLVGTGRSCRRSKPEERSSSSPTTAAMIPPPCTTCDGSATNGNATRRYNCASVAPT